MVVNHVRPQDIDDEDLADAEGGTLDPEAIRSDLKKAGVDEGNGLVDALLGEARDHAERRALEDAQRAIVAGLGVPTYELPRLAGGVDLGGLYELAASSSSKDSRHERHPTKPQGPRMTRSRGRVGPLATAGHPAPTLDVDAMLDDPRTGIIVCCGSGGVGKTTASAAPALRAAERGRKVVVLTIDPPAGSPSRWASRPSTTRPGRSTTSTRRRAAASTR